MNKTLKLVLLVGIGIIVLAALALTGGALIDKMSAAHEENMSSLQGFGSSMLPGRDQEMAGAEGHSAAPTSIPETRLSTSDKIIISLSKEKDLLATELAEANTKIKELEDRIELLQSSVYSSGIASSIDDDRLYAQHSIQALLDDSMDASRFNSFQKQVMTLSSAQVYHDVLQRMGINITKLQKDTLVMEHLPVYAFCIGDNIPLVANNGDERNEIIHYLENHRKDPLPPAIQQDLEAVQAPCLELLNARINDWL